jgi:long-subunit fatty acid transport protein
LSSSASQNPHHLKNRTKLRTGNNRDELKRGQASKKKKNYGWNEGVIWEKNKKNQMGIFS